MIRYKSKFCVRISRDFGFPKGVKDGADFWCSFNTGKQLIMCNVTYQGEDVVMQPDKWYPGLILLSYGEKFPPHGDSFPESIELNKLYYLNVAGSIVGECELLRVLLVIEGDAGVEEGHPLLEGKYWSEGLSENYRK